MALLQNVATCFLIASVTACTAAQKPEARSAEDPLENQSAAWFFEQGGRAAQRGDSLRAEQYLSTSLEKGYRRERVFPLLLKVCLDGLRLRAALNYAQPELLRDPSNSELRYLVATIHLALGQPAAASSELERLLRGNARHAQAHYLLGTVAAQSFDDPGRATHHFQAYLDIAPRGARAAEVRAWLLDVSAKDTAAEGQESEAAL